MQEEPERVPDFDDLLSAAKQLEGVVRTTPLIEAEAIGMLAGSRVFVKAEGLQRGGAYKFRGAYNRLSRLSAAERNRGVVAWSSGNHGVAVSLAASILGIQAAIVMPTDAPRAKREMVISLGAEIVDYDRYRESREVMATELSRARGAALVPSFDDPDVIAGQGTVALEVIWQAAQQQVPLDLLVVPCGGGGLAAGSCLAAGAADRPIQVFGVEPAASDDTRRSLERGSRVQIPKDGMKSICDALLLPSPGHLTFQINARHLAGVVTVEDGEVAEAMRLAFDTLKLVLEPSAAVGLAAVLKGHFPRGASMAVVLSGANVDRDLFRKVLAGEM